MQPKNQNQKVLYKSFFVCYSNRKLKRRKGNDQVGAKRDNFGDYLKYSLYGLKRNVLSGKREKINLREKS